MSDEITKPVVVIDLCGSSDAETVGGNLGATLSTTRGTADSDGPKLNSSGTTNKDKRPPSLDPLSADFFTIPERKRQKAEELHSASANITNDSTLAPVLVFLRTTGGDDGIVTDGMLDALLTATTSSSTSSRSSCITCCATPHSSSRDEPHRQPRQSSSLTLLHIGQKDKWTCGYRNLQMLLASLVPTLPGDHSLFQKRHALSVMTDSSGRVICFEIPSQPELEIALEASWKAGFDASGAQHYGGAVRGRRKWIGAVEVWSVLASLGIDACILQFIRCRESRDLLGPFCSAYFASACPWGCGASPLVSSQKLVRPLLQQATQCRKQSRIEKSCGCCRLPLYLQWKGHSVIIVGVDHAPDGTPTHLLIMDPAMKGDKLLTKLQAGDLNMTRLSLHKLGDKDSQIIVPSRHAASAAEQNSWNRSINCITAASGAFRKIAGNKFLFNL